MYLLRPGGRKIILIRLKNIYPYNYIGTVNYWSAGLATDICRPVLENMGKFFGIQRYLFIVGEFTYSRSYDVILTSGNS